MTASSTPLRHDGVPAEIGGYRVVRLLARGTRAITALVHADAEARVARIFSPHCAPDVIDAEVAAHDAIRSAGAAVQRHVVVLDDLVTLADGRLALLLPQVAGPRLADVLAARHGRLELGEAITVLAPLARALDAAHDIGLTAIGLGARGIRFSADGAPVITRVQDALAGPALPHRFRALEPAYGADHAALERLGAVVAAAVRPAEQNALLAALRTPERGLPLEHALFDCADPVPVRFDATVSGDDPPGVDRRQEAPGPRPADHDATRVAVPPRVAAALDALRVLGIPASVIDPVDEAASTLVAHSARILAAIRSGLARPRGARLAVRRRFLLAGAAGAAALIVALALVASAAGGASSGASSAPVIVDAEHGDRATENGIEHASPALTGDDAQSTSMPESTLDPAAEDWPVIVEVLVDRWVRCRASTAGAGTDLDAACVASTAHRGSAAEQLITVDDSRHAVLERWSALGGETIVVERMGGAVLVDLVAAGTTTASLLVVRSEAGWRLRDVIG